MRNVTWTLHVVLDEKTDYYKANDFVSTLADDVNRKMKAKKIVGIAVAKLEPVSRPRPTTEKE